MWPQLPAGTAAAREEADLKEGAVTEEAGPKSARPGAADCGTGEERGRDAQIAIWACSSGIRAEKEATEDGGIRMVRPAGVALYVDEESFVGGSRSPYPECNVDR